MRGDRHAEGRSVRVPSDPRRSLTNTCSPRRSPAARRSVRSASWCARPSTRPSCSRRWVRHRPRGARRPRPAPPPHASTRTAGHSVVTRAGAGRVRSRHAHRPASRRYHPITRRGAADPARRRPVWEDGRAGRARRPQGRHKLQRTRAACGRLERLGARSQPTSARRVSADVGVLRPRRRGRTATAPGGEGVERVRGQGACASLRALGRRMMQFGTYTVRFCTTSQRARRIVQLCTLRGA
jgi:hypothetical protein